MAIFSRRSLQRLINENAAFLPRRQTRTHVDALNRMEKELTLSREWEVVLINSLSKRGRVEHERDFGGTTYADVYWESRYDPNHNFIADITVVSDKGLDQQNAYDALSAELKRTVKSRNLNPLAFFVRVEANKHGHYKGGSKVSLKLPGRARLGEKIFGTDFRRFLDRISQNPRSSDRFVIQTDEIHVGIYYNPEQQYGRGGHPSYKVVYLIDDNVIYNALSHKASQLTRTNFKGRCGILLCDGGCRFLSGDTLDSLRSYSLNDVISHFLREQSFISFVVTFVVKRQRKFTMSAFDANPYGVYINLYRGSSYGDLGFDLMQFLGKLSFPEPQLDAANAINHLKWANQSNKPHQGSYHYGGMTVKQPQMKVKISARRVLELLAGRISQEEFLRRYDFIAQENPFERALQGGKLVVSIDRTEEKDDDWIIVEMGGPDPAISHFTIPETHKK
jgi:hypothetical protein